MAGNGFTVDPASLTNASQTFARPVATVAGYVQAVAGALGVSTGDPSLDALITSLAGQVVTSLAGTGQSMQADSANLSLNAAMYTMGDLMSMPGGGQTGP